MTQAVQLAQYGANNVGLSFKNRIINGDMVIAQRTTSAVTVNADAAFFAVDRFQAAGQGSDGVYTIQQSSVAPTGFVNSTIATVTTADASIGSTQQYNIQQHIEGYNVADLGWGTANAATVTLSFWVRISLTGTFSGALRNSAANRSYPFSYSIPVANTWTQITVTIPGDTTGTWLTTNGIGVNVIWTLGAGTSRLGTANSWQAANLQGVTGQTQWISTLGATFYITGVQLEKGTVATSFDYLPYGTELMLCQRYLEICDMPYIYMPNPGVVNGDLYWNMPLKVTKRASPTITATTTLQYYSGGTGTNFSPSLSGSVNQILITGNGLTNATGFTGQQSVLRATAEL
jgi:hypothetical protein